MIRVTVTLDGKPLRYTFISHTPDFKDPIFALTDGNGVARIGEVSPSAHINVIVHAHNLAVRMLDGTNPSLSELSLRFKNKTNGSTLNITRANKKHFPHYEIMDRCYDVYETVFRSIPPFNSRSRQVYPYGGANDPVHEQKRKPRVDCRFPEALAPGKLPWVQPQSVMSGVPLMHIKPQRTDTRLFGTPTRPATTIPHEFAHAMHFATLSRFTRWELAVRYGVWIAGELRHGRSGTHRTNKRTAPLIAFIEAMGIFSQRFYFFAKDVRPELSGAPLRAAFVDDELSASPSLKTVLPGYVQIGTRRPDGTIKPRLTGSATEGAVYGAIFLDFASRANLADAVNMYLRCGGFDFDDFVKYGRTRRDGRFRADLKAVGTTWRMET